MFGLPCLVTASMLKFCSKALSLCSRSSMNKPCLVTASNMCFLLFMISNFRTSVINTIILLAKLD